MHVGINCFKDNQIRSMIESYNMIGNCEITGDVDCYYYDTEEGDAYLEEYFNEILDVFMTKNELFKYDKSVKTGFLKSFLYRWDIFDVNENKIERILTGVCKNRYITDKDVFEQEVVVRETFDIDYLEKNCILNNYSWEEFCCYIKHINRYYARHFNFSQLELLLKNIKKTFDIGELTLYRARISDIKGFVESEMYAPPIDLVSAGRTNSEGIQCLYLSGDIETTFHEIRAKEFDYVSVGEFKLKRKITIVDLSLFDEIGPFSLGDYDMTWFAINIDIIRNIANEIAKPLSRYDSSLDYIPTQYISDFIKYLGYDGIKYKSTMNKDATNYAIFDEKKFKCNNVNKYHIKNLKYGY